jgi:nitrite reductase/ring-hydroxylating ferredoxin subunit
MGLVAFLEKSWSICKNATGILTEDNTIDAMTRLYGGKYFLIKSKCPHCGSEMVHKEIVKHTPSYVGTGCPVCNRKVRVNVN